MTGPADRRWTWRRAILPVLALTVAGCTSSASPSRHPPQTSTPSGRSASESTAQQRFTVVLSPQARQLASSAGVSLSQVVASALSHINTLLPGQPAIIVVNTGTPSQLIQQAGVGGFTIPTTGDVVLATGPDGAVLTAPDLGLLAPA